MPSPSMKLDEPNSGDAPPAMDPSSEPIIHPTKPENELLDEKLTA